MSRPWLALVVKRGRRKESGERWGDGRRLVSAPLYAGGEIADYIIGWDAHSRSASDPWQRGARIMMLFEDAGAQSLVPAAAAALANTDAGAEAEAAAAGSGAGAGADGAAALPTDVWGNAIPAAAPMDDVAVAVGGAEGAEAGPPAPAAGIIKAADGKEYYLGRVIKVKSGEDPWENTQIIFDSDPEVGRRRLTL